MNLIEVKIIFYLYTISMIIMLVTSALSQRLIGFATKCLNEHTWSIP